ncbi:hypothetical protein D477_002196 [Arthrobacter crystallopoietes BAB-32]|uniref:Integral membrane protein n=1 Tax=Arthrobacter crystallopoietes BAB-32 TaxID=1246476 RepID=N1V6Y4_9MICC|nr:hypothetical protein [Arthrobacter crystallopoietes]EMY35857.1 hypothetical protein D477_002196 [Arthrobacter crystallopoietes BAB-32]
MTVVVALLLAAATYAANKAAGEWQSATTEEIRWSAASLEQLRFVYLDEAPDAFTIARWESRADVLDERSAGGRSPLLEAEAKTARASAEQKIFGLKGTNALIAERYRLPGGGFDVVRRLADLQRQEANDSAVSGPVLMAKGDRYRTIALGLALACIPVVVTWFLLQPLTRKRRPDGRPDSTPPILHDAGLLPHPWTAPQHTRGLTAVALVAWTLVTLIPVGSLFIATAGQRSDAEAMRIAVTISTYLQASNLHQSQASLQDRTMIELTQSGLARQLTAIDLDDSAQMQLGEADVHAADAWSRIAAKMARMPDTDDGIEIGLVRAISSTPDIWADALRVQSSAAETGDRAGDATNLLTLAVTLAALAMSLVTLALARPGSALMPAGGAILLAAAMLTAFAGTAAFV